MAANRLSLAHSFVNRDVAPCKQADWSKELKAKPAHYGADLKVCLAKLVTLEQVAAALPADHVVASIALREVCTVAMREAIVDPERALLPTEEVAEPLPKGKLHFVLGGDRLIIRHLAKDCSRRVGAGDLH